MKISEQIYNFTPKLLLSVWLSNFACRVHVVLPERQIFETDNQFYNGSLKAQATEDIRYRFNADLKALAICLENVNGKTFSFFQGFPILLLNCICSHMPATLVMCACLVGGHINLNCSSVLRRFTFPLE